jgi:hypothetical protein
MSEKSKSELLMAVERWIKAEWAFRAGPCAYNDSVANAMLAAEDNLRKVATGKKWLMNAARRLGVDVDGTSGKDKKRNGKSKSRRAG